MTIFPKVKEMIKSSGHFSKPISYRLPDELKPLDEILSVNFQKAQNNDVTLIFNHVSSYKEEEYRLSVTDSYITVSYSDYHGALYGIVTLIQLLEQGPLFLQDIHDYPDLKIRGVMIDISRDKIPTLSTLKQIVSHLMMLKINHLQLYVEGLAIEYPSFKDYQINETPFLLDEYEKLEAFAKTRGIDLVGNMNSFGHMTSWLAMEDFHELSECPDGFVQWGFPFLASTLNPLDPKSLDFVKKLYQDFIPHTKSKYFNINCDEPFELGRGKSKEVCEKSSVETVYLSFVKQLIGTVKEYQKQPMMWGDVLINHPKAADQLPKDTIFIDWGYDRSYDFSSHASQLNSLGLPFILAPGTSTWNSFTGRFQDMYLTTKNACISAKKYGGLGVITTDWGDNGHLQYFPWSYLGIAYLAQSSWCDDYDEFSSLHDFLNHFVFNDETNTLSQAMKELSSYNDSETHYVFNGTTLFQILQYVDPTNRFPYELKKSTHAEMIKQNPLSLTSIQTLNRLINCFHEAIQDLKISSLLYNELIQTENFLRLGILVNVYLNYPESVDKQAIISLLDKLIDAHRKLWLARNKSGGLDRSLSRLIVLKEFIVSA